MDRICGHICVCGSRPRSEFHAVPYMRFLICGRIFGNADAYYLLHADRSKPCSVFLSCCCLLEPGWGCFDLLAVVVFLTCAVVLLCWLAMCWYQWDFNVNNLIKMVDLVNLVALVIIPGQRDLCTNLASSVAQISRPILLDVNWIYVCII